MSDSDLIRKASSKWLRDNEAPARQMLADLNPKTVQSFFFWSDWQLNNMLTYLDMVDDAT